MGQTNLYFTLPISPGGGPYLSGSTSIPVSKQEANSLFQFQHRFNPAVGVRSPYLTDAR